MRANTYRIDLAEWSMEARRRDEQFDASRACEACQRQETLCDLCAGAIVLVVVWGAVLGLMFL